MSFYNKIRDFLGLSQQPPAQTAPDTTERTPPTYWQYNDQPQQFGDAFSEQNQRSFNIFSDPIEIHRFFEQQMSEMLRNFGFQEFHDGFGAPPQIEEAPDDGSNLREQYLKPGYEKDKNTIKSDEDMDGKLDYRDLDSIFARKKSVQPTQKSTFFGSSTSSKTIINSDGSMEIHKTVRDSHGNEETTITRKRGEQEHTIIKRRDKDGKEEIIENLINIDEQGMLPLPETSSIYDKFFK